MAALALVNGKIVTVDEQFSIRQAVAIEGERITAVGEDAAVLARSPADARVADLGGRTVIPGLIDNHNHFVRATEHAEVRLDGVRTRAAALDQLARGAAGLADGQWLLTLGGWHEEQWAGDRRELTLAELDAVAPGRPAFIQAQYDHASVNTAWLDAMNVPASDGLRTTGRVGGGLVALNRAAAGFPAGVTGEAGVRAAMAYYNSLGLTTVFDPGGVGVSAADIAAAREILATAAITGWPVQTHSVTTGGLALVLDAYEQADKLRPIRPLRWSVTHAEGITPEQIECARRLGVTVQLRSQSVIRDSRATVAPLRLLQDCGLSWGLGTDGTRAAQINPFISLWWAVTGRSLGGARILDEPLTREEALIAHTRSNAQLVFRENYLGSIRPGLLADLLVLDRDYLTVPDDEIRDIRPAATIVGGEVVHGALP